MLWLTAGPAHLAGRLNINIHPLAVLTAVSYRIGDDGAVCGGFVQSRGPRRCCGRVVRRESVMLWLTADPTHLAGRLKVNIHPLAVVTAVSNRFGGGVGRGWGEDRREVVRNAVVVVW